MNSAIDDTLLMLVIINPFAQMVYLSRLIEDTTPKQFANIYGQGIAMTLGVCLLCAFVGEFVLFKVFQITLPAMRVFGGLINLQLAYSYVMKGPEGIKLFRGDITQLAQQIALPVMVGAGVVWVSIRIGKSHPPLATAGIIFAAIAINGAAVLLYQLLLNRVKGRLRTAVIKYFGMAMRLNAMLIGAVSIQMILGGALEFIALHAPAAAADIP